MIRTAFCRLPNTRCKETGKVYWLDIFAIGLKGLLVNKLRALLSTLGIVFGVGAVIAMMSVGEGARQEAIEQIKLLGTNNIRIKQLTLTGEKREEALRIYSRGLTYRDALLVRDSLPGLITVASLKFINSEILFEGKEGSALVVGTDPEFVDVTNFRVGQGRFLTHFDLADTKTICILGHEIKEELFGFRDALGATIRIGDTRFTVVGVMEPKTVRKGRGTVIKIRNINRDVYVPITTALRRMNRTDRQSGIEEIAIRVTRAEKLTAANELITKIIKKKHREIKDFEVVIPEELLAQAQRTQRLFNIIIGSIAAISLIVGGIGIMNIMLANVSERTREIGIRRAIGATKRDIMVQFLIEAVLICLVGGAIGAVLGFGIAQIIARFADWATAFSPSSVPIALGTAVVVGLVFGIIPARRAAALHPVQALRAE